MCDACVFRVWLHLDVVFSIDCCLQGPRFKLINARVRSQRFVGAIYLLMLSSWTHPASFVGKCMLVRIFAFSSWLLLVDEFNLARVRKIFRWHGQCNNLFSAGMWIKKHLLVAASRCNFDMQNNCQKIWLEVKLFGRGHHREFTE